MNIDFDNPKHELLVNDFVALCKKFNRKGEDWATEIIITLDVLRAAETLHEVPHVYHPHPLQGDYKGCFAVYLLKEPKKYRVIFRPNHDGDPNFRIDNPKSITSISIIEIFKDYHKK